MRYSKSYIYSSPAIKLIILPCAAVACAGCFADLVVSQTSDVNAADFEKNDGKIICAFCGTEDNPRDGIPVLSPFEDLDVARALLLPALVCDTVRAGIPFDS